MKRMYQAPETVTIGVEIETAMLVGSDQSDHSDAKKRTSIEEEITSHKIASESIPQFNVWDD